MLYLFCYAGSNPRKSWATESDLVSDWIPGLESKLESQKTIPEGNDKLLQLLNLLIYPLNLPELNETYSPFNLRVKIFIFFCIFVQHQAHQENATCKYSDQTFFNIRTILYFNKLPVKTFQKHVLLSYFYCTNVMT